jgi:protein-L-isoaspartate(D-aspartate) O-methyltransferase
MSYLEKRKNLINTLKLEGYIKSRDVEQAFLDTPREEFVPDQMKKYSYFDTPLEIGNGQTISAPHMVAIMIEALDFKKGQIVLEIGAGSGYHVAVASKLVGVKGRIYTIERFPSLVDYAKQNLKNTGIANVSVELGDGSEGLVKYSPYDRIYVTCAAPDVPPPLTDQLKDKGKLLIPVGETICNLMLIEKNKGKLNRTSLGGCAFVPLVGKYGHP